MKTNLKQEKVLVLGAHPDPSRYAYRAAHMLKDAGHDIVLVGRRDGSVAGSEIQREIPSFAPGEIDTVTLYVNPTIQEGYKSVVEALQPNRVIFNPGTENPEWMISLKAKGIEPDVACTLVLLSTGQY
ncbi:CoA-binding protein [Phaeocystidibacter luteus]|uniref:CoA-binding protein n=1 Tax=Phaeocystidibacter luteus TaxID=911197 RepID=A0A6N6RLL5_9FLAO|nr:CoA-binding protein [Phaeocystidibacter luteus]KAB2814451.1 CoA-binding protein [Phaeocystidibacter luteus]